MIVTKSWGVCHSCQTTVVALNMIVQENCNWELKRTENCDATQILHFLDKLVNSEDEATHQENLEFSSY